MIILVDYENTHQSGMEGYWYLDSSDTMILYYSDQKSSMPKGWVDKLKEKGVEVKLVKLQAKRDNALDMYIAASTGIYAEQHEKICIVSKDKGYQAVRDFWRMVKGTQILLGETIEQCLLHSMDNSDPRIRLVRERHQKVNLVDEFCHMDLKNILSRPMPPEMLAEPIEDMMSEQLEQMDAAQEEREEAETVQEVSAETEAAALPTEQEQTRPRRRRRRGGRKNAERQANLREEAQPESRVLTDETPDWTPREDEIEAEVYLSADMLGVKPRTETVLAAEEDQIPGQVSFPEFLEVAVEKQPVKSAEKAEETRQMQAEQTAETAEDPAQPEAVPTPKKKKAQNKGRKRKAENNKPDNKTENNKSENNKPENSKSDNNKPDNNKADGKGRKQKASEKKEEQKKQKAKKLAKAETQARAEAPVGTPEQPKAGIGGAPARTSEQLKADTGEAAEPKANTGKAEAFKTGTGETAATSAGDSAKAAQLAAGAKKRSAKKPARTERREFDRAEVDRVVEECISRSGNLHEYYTNLSQRFGREYGTTVYHTTKQSFRDRKKEQPQG